MTQKSKARVRNKALESKNEKKMFKLTLYHGSKLLSVNVLFVGATDVWLALWIEPSDLLRNK